MGNAVVGYRQEKKGEKFLKLLFFFINRSVPYSSSVITLSHQSLPLYSRRADHFQLHTFFSISKSNIITQSTHNTTPFLVFFFFFLLNQTICSLSLFFFGHKKKKKTWLSYLSQTRRMSYLVTSSLSSSTSVSPFFLTLYTSPTSSSSPLTSSGSCLSSPLCSSPQLFSLWPFSLSLPTILIRKRVVLSFLSPNGAFCFLFCNLF